MRIRAHVVAAASLGVLLVEFLVLENGVVTTNPAAQKLGRLVGLPALGAFACSVAVLVAGRLGRSASRAAGRRERSPDEKGSEGRTGTRCVQKLSAEPARRRIDAGTVPAARGRLRSVKVAAGLLVFASWFVGMPLYVHQTLIVKAPDFTPGPWAADAFLSVFAVAVQCAAPTPVGLAFWPSAAMATYLLFSRKDRPALDAVFGVTAVGIVFGLWYIMVRGIQLGAR